MERFSLAGRCAVVTGGGRGIGRALAEAMAEAGARVALGSRRARDCQAVAEQLRRDYGVDALALTVDVSQPDSVAAFHAAVMEWTPRVDILINNSGRSWGAEPWAIPVDRWNETLAVNVTGTWMVSMAFGRRMVEQGAGSIINIASVAGVKGFPAEGLNALGYSGSKAAVIGLTRDLAVKWARYGVRVNAIAPGFFPTRMTEGLLREDAARERILASIPMGRLGDVEDLKGAAIFLASDASRYVTGQVIAVDGGQTAS